MLPSRITTLLLATALTICFSLTSFAQPEARRSAQKIDSIKSIQKAYDRQSISYQTALNYKVLALFNKKRLPKAYQSDMVIKTATPVMLEARNNAAILYDENAFILARPTEEDETSPGHYYGDGIAIWTYDSPAGYFRIHYTENDTRGDAVFGSDGLQSTVPSYVTDFASYFDTAWNTIVDTLGYPVPASDGTAGGDSKRDVYILDMDAYGYTAFELDPSNAYIVVENDFTGFPENLDSEGDRTGSMKVTAAHELFHVFLFQYSTNLFTNGWWSEASATWIEDVAFPAVNDYLNYIGSKYDDENSNGKWDSGEPYYRIDGETFYRTTGRQELWFDHPNYSLDSTSGTHEYGTVMLAKYLANAYDRDIIQSIWERVDDGKNSLEAISDEITARGGLFDTFFEDFLEASYKRDYPDGLLFPALKHRSSYNSSDTNISLSGTLEKVSSVLYLIKADETDSTFELTFSNMHSGNLLAKLILTTASDEYEVTDIALDSYTVTHLVDVSDYSRASLIIMNTSLFSDEIYTAYINGTEQAGSGSSSSGTDSRCFIATAAYGSYLDPHVETLRNFRDNHLLTNRPGRVVVDLYYRTSPPLAQFISEHEWLRAVTRWCLMPIILSIDHPLKATFLLTLLLMFIASKGRSYFLHTKT